MNVDRWAERIYAERDFGRSVATSGAGAAGLIVYLQTYDWVIAGFSAIIIFPVLRIVASAAHKQYKRKTQAADAAKHAQDLISNLSEEEKGVLREFVRLGGSVMSWSHANRVGLHEPAVSSLMQREYLYSTMTADGMNEAFGITVEVFDLAQKALAAETDF